jgi:hypothetical protein
VARPQEMRKIDVQDDVRVRHLRRPPTAVTGPRTMDDVVALSTARRKFEMLVMANSRCS